MLLEAVITAGLAHRNLAATHGHVWVSRRVGASRGEDVLADNGPQSGLLLELASPERWRADVVTWAASPEAGLGGAARGAGGGSSKGLKSGWGAGECRGDASGSSWGREHSPIAMEMRARRAADWSEACTEAGLPAAGAARRDAGKLRQAGRVRSSGDVGGGSDARGRREEVWLIVDFCDRGCLQARRTTPHLCFLLPLMRWPQQRLTRQRKVPAPDVPGVLSRCACMWAHACSSVWRKLQCKKN